MQKNRHIKIYVSNQIDETHIIIYGTRKAKSARTQMSNCCDTQANK